MRTLKTLFALMIGVLTVFVKFRPALVSIFPLMGIIYCLLDMRKANKFHVFLATLAMAVCIVALILTLIPFPFAKEQ